MSKSKDFPLTSFDTALGNLQSSLRDAESQFKEDQDLSDSIKQTRESVAKVINSKDSNTKTN